MRPKMLSQIITIIISYLTNEVLMSKHLCSCRLIHWRSRDWYSKKSKARDERVRVNWQFIIYFQELILYIIIIILIIIYLKFVYGKWNSNNLATMIVEFDANQENDEHEKLKTLWTQYGVTFVGRYPFEFIWYKIRSSCGNVYPN